MISIDTQLGTDEYEVGTVEVPLTFTAGEGSAAEEADAGASVNDIDTDESDAADD